MRKTSRRLHAAGNGGGKGEGLSGSRSSLSPQGERKFPNPERVEALVRALDNEHPAERGRARAMLIHMGRPAVPRLIEALHERSERLRWEAARSLTAIRDPRAAPALVGALEDEIMEVRWVAEDGVIELGKDGLVALLHGLITHSGSNRFREAAHRILIAMSRGENARIAKPVLEALNGPAPIVALPVAAYTALSNLKSIS